MCVCVCVRLTGCVCVCVHVCLCSANWTTQRHIGSWPFFLPSLLIIPLPALLLHPPLQKEGGSTRRRAGETPGCLVSVVVEGSPGPTIWEQALPALLRPFSLPPLCPCLPAAPAWFKPSNSPSHLSWPHGVYCQTSLHCWTPRVGPHPLLASWPLT